MRNYRLTNKQKEERYNLAKTMRKSGKTYKEISKKLGVSEEAVRKLLIKGYKQATQCKIIYPKIKEWVEENKYSINDISRKTGISSTHLYNLFKGRTKPSYKDVREFEKIFNSRIETILK